MWEVLLCFLVSAHAQHEKHEFYRFVVCNKPNLRAERKREMFLLRRNFKNLLFWISFTASL